MGKCFIDRFFSIRKGDRWGVWVKQRSQPWKWLVEKTLKQKKRLKLMLRKGGYK